MKLKRLLSAAVCVLLLCSLLSLSALAAEESCGHHTHGESCAEDCSQLCDTCVADLAEIQTRIDALPEMTDITAEMKDTVSAALADIDARRVLLDEAVEKRVDFTRADEAAFAVAVPEGYFGVQILKVYEGSDGPAASFAFLDEEDEKTKLLAADGVAESTETQPIEAGDWAYYYLPAGTYSVEETVEGKWNLSLSVNTEAATELSGEAGKAYRLMAANYFPLITVDGLEYRITGSGAVLLRVVGEFEEEIPVPLEVEYEDESYFVRAFAPDMFNEYEESTLVYAGTREQWEEHIGNAVDKDTLGVKNIKYHEHNWHFSAEGAVITAVCDVDCPEEDLSATITLKAPAALAYDGNEKSCAVEQSEPAYFDLSTTAVVYSATPVNAGDYSAAFTYGGVSAEVTFSIAAIDISAMSIGTIPNQSYCASALTPAVSLAGLTEGADYTVAYSNNTNAGTAAVAVSGIGNYTGTIAGSFVIEPAVITVTGVNVADRAYDGSDQVSVTTLSLSGIIAGDQVTVAGLYGLKAAAPSANAGTYTEATLPALSLTGADAGNYVLTQPGKLPAAFTISPRAVTPTVEVAAGSYVYNGKAHTPAVTVKDGSAVIPAGEYSVRYDYNVNAGIGRVYISDVSGGNYALNPAEGSFTIQQALITITADNKTATVGQKAPTPTYSTYGVVPGEVFVVLPIVEYVTTPDMTKAGTTVIRASSAVAPSANYTIKYVDGTLTVTGTGSGSGNYGGSVAVTVDMSGVKLDSKTYDGKPLTYSGAATGRYYYGDFTYTWYTANGYRLSEAPTDAGDYVLRATVSRSGYSGYASKNVSIHKAQLTLTADDLSAYVGDEVPELSYSVKGLAAGDKLKTEPKLSFETEPDMSKAGKTVILVSGAAVPDSKNYETTIRYIEGTLIVNKAVEESKENNETKPEPTPAPLLKLEVSVGEENKALDKELDSKESAFYDLALQSSTDGGTSWNEAAEQLPAEGVKVSLPLPEGSDENCSFRVMYEGGEYPVTVTKHEDGKYYLDFTASELGTVAVGWTAPGKSGGFPWVGLLAGLGVTGAAGGGFALWRKRRKV